MSRSRGRFPSAKRCVGLDLWINLVLIAVAWVRTPHPHAAVDSTAPELVETGSHLDTEMSRPPVVTHGESHVCEALGEDQRIR